MVSACVVPTDTVGDLFKIQGTLNQHGYHSILEQHAFPSGLRLVGPSFVFQQDNDPKRLTSRLCLLPLKLTAVFVIMTHRQAMQRIFEQEGV